MFEHYNLKYCQTADGKAEVCPVKLLITYAGDDNYFDEENNIEYAYSYNIT